VAVVVIVSIVVVALVQGSLADHPACSWPFERGEFVKTRLLQHAGSQMAKPLGPLASQVAPVMAGKLLLKVIPSLVAVACD
jgi:hypothetical protein